MQAYPIPNVSSALTKRFNSAITYVNAYKQKLSSYFEEYQNSGADFGNSYLAEIAANLKKNFENSAKLYMISGHEFCFVFNDNTNQNTASMIATTSSIPLPLPTSSTMSASRCPQPACCTAIAPALPRERKRTARIARYHDFGFKKNGGNRLELFM